MSPLRWNVHVAGLPAGETCWPARVSLPLAPDTVIPNFSVERPDGSRVPAQSRVLVAWPNGSPRWVQIEFQVRSAGPHVVLPQPSDAPVDKPLKVLENAGLTTVSVGRLTVVIAPGGPSPVRAVRWAGRELTGATPCEFQAVDADGTVYRLNPDSAHDIRVEASGPQRYQVSWEMAQSDDKGRQLLDVRFRLELLAGVEGFSLSYQFFHKLPGREFLALRSLDADFAFPGLAEGGGKALAVQQAHGVLNMRRVVRTEQALPLILDRTRKGFYVEDLACIDDDSVYPHFLRSCAGAMEPIVGLQDDAVAVAVSMRDLINQRPKTIDAQPGGVRFGIWPERAGVLELPQGRSNAQRFCFLFSPAEPDLVDARLMAPAACDLEPANAWLDAADTADAGATWDASRLFTGKEEGAPLFAAVLDNATTRYKSVAEMFHYGDSPHAGYTTTYAGLGRRCPEGAPAPEFRLEAGARMVHTGITTVSDLEPVWANNEYDAIYCLALQVLRTRDAATMAKLRATARHQIEVDFVHYSDHWMQHRGTPCHTFDHTACSTAYPSHQWTQGLYYYYCLTGDDDVPEVVRAICDFNIEWLANPELELNHYFNRELGWAGIAFVFGYELTGDETYRKEAEKLLKELVACAYREDFDDAMKQCSSLRGSNAKQLGAAFAINTIPMAVRVFHQATGEPWARELFLEWVRIGFENYNDKATGPKLVDMFSECFSYAVELTEDPQYLEDSLWHLQMLMLGYNNVWVGTAPIDAKLYGRQYRGLVHYLSACARAGLLPEAERRLLGTATRAPAPSQ